MNFRHSTSTPLVLCVLLAALTPAPAEIDSGGGKSSGGALSNHSSIGAAFATLPTQGAATVLHPGLIEVLYPVAPAATDSDGNGLPDAWETLHFGHLGLDPNADPDHDGASNLMEYLAGTARTAQPPCSDRKGVLPPASSTCPFKPWRAATMKFGLPVT